MFSDLFELAPEKTAKILSKIYKDDQRISKLAKKLKNNFFKLKRNT